LCSKHFYVIRNGWYNGIQFASVGVLVHILLVSRERVMREGNTNKLFLELQRTHL